MNRTSLRRMAGPGIAAVALSLGLSACGAGNESTANGGDSSATVEGLSGTLNGAGASSQEAAQAAWQAGFQTANPDVTVNYDPVGSGGGREQFIAGGVAFAGSDAYLSDEEGELAAAKERCLGEDPIEIPNYVSPIAVIHNVEGLDELQLSGETLAGIFAGDITKWDDPAIAEDNPDADLPAATITPVHRADDSGTTDNFTAYLDSVAGDVWTHGEVGEEYVAPSPEAAAKVLEVSPRVEGRADTDMAFDLDRSTQESGAYPIVLTSYLIACPTYEDANTADLVKGYLSYIVSDEGQQAAAETAGSAPLSDALQEEAQGIIDDIKAGG